MYLSILRSANTRKKNKTSSRKKIPNIMRIIELYTILLFTIVVIVVVVVDKNRYYQK